MDYKGNHLITRDVTSHLDYELCLYPPCHSPKNQVDFLKTDNEQAHFKGTEHLMEIWQTVLKKGRIS